MMHAKGWTRRCADRRSIATAGAVARLEFCKTIPSTMYMLRALLLPPLFFLVAESFGQAALLVLIFGDKAATENFHFSIDAGMNVSMLPGVNGSSTAHGVYFGLGTYVRINDRWAFTPEFKPVSPRGANGFDRAFVDTVGATGTSSTALRTRYIDVPLQLHRSLGDRFYVRAGPQFSFLTKAELATSGELVGGDAFTVTQDVKDRLEPFDVSIPVDVGFRFAKPRGYKGVDLRIRYTHGLMEVFKENPGGIASRNGTFQFFVSLPFVNVEPKPGS